MLPKLLSSLLLTFIINNIAFATTLEPVTPIELTNHSDVNDAQMLNNAIDNLSDRVMNCVQDKLAKASKCYCLYPNEIAHVQDNYKAMISKHPEWVDQVLFWWRDSNHDYSYNLSLQGLRIQLEQNCD